MMKHIRISNNAHMKIVNRKTYELTSVEKVVDDIMMRIDGAETPSVAASNEPCKQCEEYKEELNACQQKLIRMDADYNAAMAANDTLEYQLDKAKEKTEALEPVSDVVVADDTDESGDTISAESGDEMWDNMSEADQNRVSKNQRPKGK